MLTQCTICGIPLLGSPDDDVCCAACDAINFPPPDAKPLPWWEAVRGTLAPCRDGMRALLPQEETPHGP